MSYVRIAVVAVLAVVMAAPAASQERRPVPYPVTPSNAFQEAIERGTRTADGRPGAAHWVNVSSYRIAARLDPVAGVLEGEQTVVYHNNSPYTLDRLYLHLYQNLHQAGAVRNRPQEVTGGLTLSSVAADGTLLEEQSGAPGYTVRGTVMMVRLASPVGPGGDVALDMSWQFDVPLAGAPRMGHDGEVYFLGYWYPQIAVFDDVQGWVVEPYLSEGEFYMGFADYEVEITVPDGWVVAATGRLVNDDEVLEEEVRARLAGRVPGGDVVHVVTEADIRRDEGRRTAAAGTKTWRFQAEKVRDFAFGTSDHYVWDSAIATLPGGGTTDVHVFYRPDQEAWREGVEFTRYSLEFMSERFMPYPWPHMTVVEGIIGGGMEYPMITLIGGNRSPRSLFSTTLHEVVHMWFPMIVNQDEKRFTWMDEGLASFFGAEGTAEYLDEEGPFAPARQTYYRLAGSDLEVEPVRHADRFPLGGLARSVAHYSKPAVAFNTLRHLVGEDVFAEALREYADRWAYRHPYPWDLYNTFSDVTGRDLDWFWRTMLYETWTHDLAIGDVTAGGSAVRVVVEDRGLAPMPATVRVTYDDGMMIEQEIPVEVWLEGEREIDLEFQAGNVVRVEIDPEMHLPDVDRSNNVWRGSEPAIGG